MGTDGYEVIKVERVYSGFYALENATVRYVLPNGEWSGPEPRLTVERGDAACVLVYNRDIDRLVLVKQFRYPMVRHGEGWFLEIAAGKVDEGESPEEAARRELREELGYEAAELIPVGSFSSSCGGSSEMNFVFFAEVGHANRVEEGGGIEEEGIFRVELSPSEAIAMLDRGEIKDGKAVVALQWLARFRPNLVK